MSASRAQRWGERVVSEPKEGAGPTDPSRAKSDAAEAGGVSADAYGVTEDREGGRHRGREVALQVLCNDESPSIFSHAGVDRQR